MFLLHSLVCILNIIVLLPSFSKKKEKKKRFFYTKFYAFSVFWAMLPSNNVYFGFSLKFGFEKS